MPMEDIDPHSANKIQDAIEGVSDKLGAQLKDVVFSVLDRAFNQGIAPKASLGIGEQSMEAIYAQAYNMYNQGKYTEASYIFRLLMMLEYTQPKYVLGMAASLHRLKQYALAANMYAMCASLDPTNPLPHYHAADCYLQEKEIKLAIDSLESAIHAASEQQKYAILKERAVLMKDSLEEYFIKMHYQAENNTQDAEKPAH